MVWDECAAVGMPRAVVVTHLESARADFEEMTAICARVFGGDDPDAVLPLYLPLHGEAGPDGHARSPAWSACCRSGCYDYSSGERERRAPDPEHLPLIERASVPADRGDHRRERGRDPDGPLPRR